MVGTSKFSQRDALYTTPSDTTAGGFTERPRSDYYYRNNRTTSDKYSPQSQHSTYSTYKRRPFSQNSSSVNKYNGYHHGSSYKSSHWRSTYKPSMSSQQLQSTTSTSSMAGDQNNTDNKENSTTKPLFNEGKYTHKQ